MASNPVTILDEWKQNKNAHSMAPGGREPELPLYGGGGGGGNMDPNVMLKDYVDARDDAVESRLSAKLDKLPTESALRNNIWGAAAAVLGVMLAVLAFGSDRFNGGLSISPALVAVQTEQNKTDATQDAKLAMMDRKLDILLERSATGGSSK